MISPAQAADANFPQPSDDMVKLLASRGAKLDVVDKQGRSPVEMAKAKPARSRGRPGETPRTDRRAAA